MKYPLLSIVIPVYNVGNYLARCLNSIQAQTYKNWEIIAIDDGSTDDSGSILNKYEQIDSRIRVLHISNQGVSNARNIGIDNSKGEFIGFVDSDDWIKPNMFMTMIQLAVEHDCDFVQSEYEQVDDKGNVNFHNCPTPGLVSGVEQIVALYSKETIHNSVCTKLIKRNLIGEQRFNTGLHIGEDAQFTYLCCKKSSKAYLNFDSFYCYFQRANSSVHKKTNKYLINVLEVLDEQIADTLQWPNIHENLKYRKVTNIIRLIILEIEGGMNYSYMDPLRLQLKMYLKFYCKKTNSIKKKVKAYIACYCPCLFRIYHNYLHHVQ